MKTYVTLSLIFIFFFKTADLNDLNVTYNLQEELEVKICNPTYRFVSLQDGLNQDDFSSLLYSKQVSVAYRTSSGELKMQNGPLKDLPSCCAYISETKYVAPSECVNKYVDILPYVPKTAELFQVHLILHEGYISGRYVPSEGVTFKSQWFDLEPSEE